MEHPSRTCLRNSHNRDVANLRQRVYSGRVELFWQWNCWFNQWFVEHVSELMTGNLNIKFEEQHWLKLMLNVGVFKFLYLIVSLIKKSIKRIFASWKVRTLLVPLLMRMTLDHIDRIRNSFVCVFCACVVVCPKWIPTTYVALEICVSLSRSACCAMSRLLMPLTFQHQKQSTADYGW